MVVGRSHFGITQQQGELIDDGNFERLSAASCSVTAPATRSPSVSLRRRSASVARSRSAMSRAILDALITLRSHPTTPLKTCTRGRSHPAVRGP
jgi:hypothetical protein